MGPWSEIWALLQKTGWPPQVLNNPSAVNLAYVNMELRLHMKTNFGLIPMISWHSPLGPAGGLGQLWSISQGKCAFALYEEALQHLPVSRDQDHIPWISRWWKPLLLTSACSVVWHVSWSILIKTILPGFTHFFLFCFLLLNTLNLQSSNL